jgi:hypothetical protein
VTNGNVIGSAQFSQSNGALTIKVQASGMFHNTAYATSLTRLQLDAQSRLLLADELWRRCGHRAALAHVTQ